MIYGFINHVRHRSFNDYISSSLSDVRGEQEHMRGPRGPANISCDCCKEQPSLNTKTCPSTFGFMIRSADKLIKTITAL